MLTVDPYPYQNHAIDMGLDRGNLLLAYGMGLGKTLVQMGICEELLGNGESTLNAIVVPASLKWQWAQALVWGTDVEPREFRLKGQKISIPERRHAVVIDGTPEKRDVLYKYCREYRPNYVILGYENVVNDWREVHRLQPDLIALDEATAIKTFNASRTKRVKEWWAPYRYALTGTPIDNRADELYSIMEWVDEVALGRWKHFDKSFITRDGYGKVKRYKNLNVLHSKIQPFVARKTRFDPDVKGFMPKDYHKEYYADLIGKAKALYKRISKELEEALQEIVGFGGFDLGAYYAGTQQNFGSKEQGDAMSMFSAMTMLCDHPMLLLESAQKFEDFIHSEKEKPVQQGSAYAYDLLLRGELDWINPKVIVPKFEDMMDQVKDILDERKENKVIVFSFAKMMLRMFQGVIGSDNSVIFDGDMNAAEKEVAKQRFKTDPKIRVFLSSDAGGLGVDLPEANYLINYNHPWSAGKADQRNSRHIRAGSSWEEVWVLNFLVNGSVEEWKYEVLDTKRRVGSAILDGGPTQNGVITFDAGSLLSWLQNNTV